MSEFHMVCMFFINAAFRGCAACTRT